MAARQINPAGGSKAEVKCATLDRVNAGAGLCVTVLEVGVKHPTQMAARGIVPGAEIRVLRGHDPLIVFVDNTRWAISRGEAGLVTVCGPAAAITGEA